MKTQSVKLDNYLLFNNNFEKARKYEVYRQQFSGLEKEHYDNLIKINHCIDNQMDKPNECVTTLSKCLNHIKKNKKQYLALGAITLLALSSNFMLIPVPTPSLLDGMAVSCCSSIVPSVNMGAVTSMLNTLISNLIKLGAMLVSASCIIDMIKSIVQGNISHLPKSLITHGLMVCSLFLSPMVFESISRAFGV